MTRQQTGEETQSRERAFWIHYKRRLGAAEHCATRQMERDRLMHKTRPLEALVASSFRNRLASFLARRVYENGCWTETEVREWLKQNGWRKSELYELFQASRRKFDRTVLAANRVLTQSGQLVIGASADSPATARAKLRRLRRREEA